ncbi:choice-of-anchor F family protein [Porticoccus hydrocarbonoclasticus]|uniref:choice-of-anchor F family protein n=1 Tax=Porticoccus hydrocarbonoclasticus TaxID=1073414 RepID=UPI001267D508|nr:choice-of-anchor F family protein [Porticoccus hydrocarbonoclasticus]
MKLKSYLRPALAIAIMGFSGSHAFAGAITGWNQGNVSYSGPDSDGNYYSTIYDKAPVDSGASTNGYIKYTPPEGAFPGLKVVNNADQNPDNLDPAPGNPVDNCIMAAGPASCNSEFQSGKRFKLDRTGFNPIDLVLNMSGESLTDNDGLYRVFQKYGNNTDSALSGFSISLGFGIGNDFISSGDGDGLSFVDFGADPKESQFSSLFAQGLFGPVDTERDRPQGYFSAERSGFNLDLVTEDLFETNGLFGGQNGYEALFGDWMSYSMAPDGYFYDNDGDPLTDAILMAHYDDATDKWIMNRELDADGEILTSAEGNDGDQYNDVAAVESALQEQASNLTLAACPEIPVEGVACLAGVGEIEDLAKFNVSYFIDPLLFSLNDLAYTAYDDQASFTLRIEAWEASTVPAPGVLVLFATGLGLLLGVHRIRRRKDVTI